MNLVTNVFFKADIFTGDEDGPEPEKELESVLFLFLKRNSFLGTNPAQSTL